MPELLIIKLGEHKTETRIGQVFEEKQLNRSPTPSPVGGNSPDLGPDPDEGAPELSADTDDEVGTGVLMPEIDR